MNAQGVLVQPSVQRTQLWDLTWQKLDRVLPKLRVEVFPGEPTSSMDSESQSVQHDEARQIEPRGSA